MNTGQITASTITVGSSILAASGMMATEVIPPNAENVSESPFAGILQDCSAARQPVLSAALARLISSKTMQPIALPRVVQTVPPPPTTAAAIVPSKIVVDHDQVNLAAHDQQQPEEIPVSGTTGIPADSLMSQNVTLLASLIGSTQQSDIPAAGKNSDQQTNNRPEAAQTSPTIAEAVVGKRTNAEVPVTHHPGLKTAMPSATTTQPIEQRQTLGTATQSVATDQAATVPVTIAEIQLPQQAIIRDNHEPMTAKQIPAATPDQGIHHEVAAAAPTATPALQEIQTAPAATTSPNVTGLPVADTKPALAATPQEHTTATLPEQPVVPVTTAENLAPAAPVTQPAATVARKLEAYFQTTPRTITATQQPQVAATATETGSTTVTAHPVPTATMAEIHPPQTAVRNNPETMTAEQISVVTPDRIVRNEAAATVPTAKPAIQKTLATTTVTPAPIAVATMTTSADPTVAQSIPPQLQQTAAPVAAQQLSTKETATSPTAIAAPVAVAVAEVHAPQPAVRNNPETMTAKQIPAAASDQRVPNEAANVTKVTPAVQEIQTANAVTTSSNATGPLPSPAAPVTQPATTVAHKLEAYFQTTPRTITATQQPQVAATATETESTIVTALPIPTAAVTDILHPQTAVRNNPETMTAEQISVVAPDQIERNEAAANIVTATPVVLEIQAVRTAKTSSNVTVPLPTPAATPTTAEPALAAASQNQTTAVVPEQPAISTGAETGASPIATVTPIIPLQLQQTAAPVAAQQLSINERVPPPATETVVELPPETNVQAREQRQPVDTTLQSVATEQAATTAKPAMTAPVATMPQNQATAALSEQPAIPATTAANLAQPAATIARKLEAYFQTTPHTATTVHPAEPVITPQLQQTTDSVTNQQPSLKGAETPSTEPFSTAAKPTITAPAVPVAAAVVTEVQSTTPQTDDALRSLTHDGNTLRHVNTVQMLVSEKKLPEGMLNRQNAVAQNGLSDVVAEQNGSATQATVSPSTFSSTSQGDGDSSTDSDQEKIWFGQPVPGNKHETLSPLKPVSFDKELQNSGTSSTAEHVMRQVKESLTNRDYRPGVEQITLHLTPENMGEMKLTFRMENQQLKIDVVTDTNIVRDTLLKHTESLKETLAKQNITVESFNVATGSNSSSSGRDQSDWRELAKQRQQTPAWMNNNDQNSDAPLPQTLVYQAKSAYSMVDVHF